MRLSKVLAPFRRELARLAAFAAGIVVMGFAGPALAALDVSMTIPSPYPTLIYPGDVTAFRITLTNGNSAAAITNVQFTDTMAGGLLVSGVGLKSYTCIDGNGNNVTPTGAVTATVGSNVIQLTGGTVPTATANVAVGQCVIDVEVTSFTRNTAPVNVIPVGGVTGDDGAAVSNGTAAQQSVTVRNLGLPVISKSFSPSTLPKGGSTSTLTIKIDNGANAAANLPLNDAADSPAYAIRDVLPPNVEVAAAPAATSTCTGAGVAPTFNPAAGATTVTAVGGTVAAGGSCTLTVKVVATGAATDASHASNVVTNTISAGGDFHNGRGLVPAANATANLTITSGLNVSESFIPGTVAAGQAALFRVTLQNAGVNALTLDATNALTLARLDGLGAGVTTYGLTVTGVTTTCNGATATATADSRGFVLAGGNLAGGTSCNVDVTYTGALQAAGTPQSFGNAIPLGAVVVASDATVASSAASASVNVIDQLTVSKSANPTNPGPGAPVQYTVTVSNYTGSLLSSLEITDNLPTGMTALSAAPYAPSVSGNCSGVTIDATTPASPKLTVATVQAGAAPPAPSTCAVKFWAQTPVSAAAGAVLSNSIAGGAVVAVLGPGPGGPIVTNHSGSNSAGVTVVDAITINKAFGASNASEGSVVPLTFTLTNASPSVTASAAFTDNFPVDSSPANSGNQLVVASPANASTTCAGGSVTATPGASSVSLAGGSIPARGANGSGALGTCTVTVSVIAGAGTYQNILPAGALTGQQTPADGTTPVAKASPGPVTSTVNYSSALVASKSFSPTTISDGGVATVTVHLENSGGGTLNDVVVTDPLPANLTVAPTPTAYTTCGGSPSIVAAAGASSVTMTGAVIPAGGQCNLLFNVKGAGAAPWTNTIPPGSISAAGGVKNVGPVSATLGNSTAGGVTVTVATSIPALTSPGQVAGLTITLTNSGSVDLTGLALTDYFTSTGLAGGAPTGMVIAGQPNASTTCAAGMVSATAGGGSVGLTGAALAHGASCTVTVNVTLTTTGTVTDLIPASAITNSQGVTNTLPTSTSLSAGANFGVTKTFLPAVIKPAETSRLRITLINPQAIAATALSFTDTLPAGVTVAAVPNATTTCTGGTVSSTAGSVSLAGGALPAASAGASTLCLVEIDVTAAAAGTYTNTIPAGGLTGALGGAPASNPAPANATLQVRQPVTIAKAFAQPTRALGQADAVTLTLTNPNAVPLTAAALTDVLPSNLTVALTPNASTTCAGGVVTAPPSATSVVLTGGTIPAGGSCTVKFDVLSNVSGTYVNTIPAGGLGTAEGVTNETPASATVKIIDPPTVSKQFSPVAIPAGGVSTLSLVLGNTNSTAATLQSALVDALPTSPAAIVVAPTPNVGGTCTTASVTATPGAGSVTYASGATVPAGGCTITVDVTGAVEGAYVNTIPVGGLHTDLGDNIQATNAPLTITPLGFISGRVFKDNNVTPNGTFEPGDVALPGVALTLSGTDYGPNGVAGGGDDVAVNKTATTDSLGNYAFTSLNPGSYTVTEPTQPVGTNNGVTTAGAVTGGGGGTPGAATGVGVTPSVISNIVLLKDGGGRVASSPANNFAEIAPSSIAGVVFLDQNNNGVQNLADTALSGVTVQLLSGASVVATTTTDGAGAYQFTNLAPGTYTVREPTQPAGTANGETIAGAVGNGGAPGTATAATVAPSQIAGIVLPPATASTGNNFAEQPTGRQISGRVFKDANNDGLFNGADAVLANVTLALTGTDLNGFAVSASTTTGADGRYVFTGLAAGNYTVTEPTQPRGTLNGITTAGSASGVATAVAVTPSAISAIPLTGATTISADNNFAEIAAPSGGPGAVQVSGKVYVDLNDNGAPDAGEVGIGGVTVTLVGTSSRGDAVALTTQTLANGDFVFATVPASGAGGYTITETQPSAYGDGKTTVEGGSPGSAVGAKPVAAGGADVISGVQVGAVSLSGYDFGERSGAALSGQVYVDLNDSGARDPGETPLAGVTVRLTGKTTGGAGVDLTTTTGADGRYAFAGLTPSDAAGYTVTEVQPSGYADGKTSITAGNPGVLGGGKPVAAGASDTIHAIVVTGSSQLTGYDFGERPRGTISGQVYVDANNNGVRDSGEAPLPGVTVRLTGKDSSGAAINLSVSTGADGAYSFTDLTPSDATGYVITEVQPSGYTDGKTTLSPGAPGAVNGGKPVAVGGSDVISAVVLAAGAQLGGYDYGELKSSGLVAGFVFVDANNNGVRDAGEAGIGDVAVRLVGADKAGAAVSLTQTTDADGAFRFTEVPASNGAGYRIIETQPPGYTDGKTALAAGDPGSASSRKPVGVGDEDVITGVVTPEAANLVDYAFGEIAVPQLKRPIVNGYVWFDRNHTRLRPTDGSVQGEPGWTVVLRQNGGLICTTTTDQNGFYQFDNLHCPGYEASGLPTGPGFSITFTRDGDNLPNVPTSGGGRGQVSGNQIVNITLGPSDEVVEQNLPLDPAGVVYDSQTRRPVPGAVVTIAGPAGFDPSTMLVGGSAAQIQTTGTDGLYQFLLQNGFPSGAYALTVTAPQGYLPAPATSLPPCAAALTVGATPNPALVQASDTAPGAGVTAQLDPNACTGLIAGGANTTQYYLAFNITNGGSAPILNNHIPLDPQVQGSLFITKTTPLVTVSRGGLVPYTITASNMTTGAITNVQIRDVLPPGFKVREGSATENGRKVSPVISNGAVTWPLESFATKQKNTYGLILVVGSGVGDGDYVNRALAIDPAGQAASNTGTATVRIAPDPTFDCPDVIGKVFDDKNANGYQDEGEPGIPGVRMATPDGLLITSDAEGRFHVPCPEIPNPDRGSNFVMKLDERTLPSGFRLTTENPRDVRITRGKMVKLNFGATIHRVVRIELKDAAFQAGATTLVEPWKTQLAGLPSVLDAQPSIVRIAYDPGTDPPDLVRKRTEAVRKQIQDAWRQAKGRYALAIEIEGAR